MKKSFCLTIRGNKILMNYFNKAEKIYPVYKRTELFNLACKNFNEKYFTKENFNFYKLESLMYNKFKNEIFDDIFVPKYIKFFISEDNIYNDMLQSLIYQKISHYKIVLIIIMCFIEDSLDSNSFPNNEIKIKTNDLLTQITNLYLNSGNEKLKEMIKTIVNSNFRKE